MYRKGTDFPPKLKFSNPSLQPDDDILNLTI